MLIVLTYVRVHITDTHTGVFAAIVLMLGAVFVSALKLTKAPLLTYRAGYQYLIPFKMSTKMIQ